MVLLNVRLHLGFGFFGKMFPRRRRVRDSVVHQSHCTTLFNEVLLEAYVKGAGSAGETDEVVVLPEVVQLRKKFCWPFKHHLIALVDDD